MRADSLALRIGYATLAGVLARAGRLDEAREAYAELVRRIPNLEAGVLATMAAGVAPDPATAEDLAQAMRRAAEA